MERGTNAEMVVEEKDGRRKEGRVITQPSSILHLAQMSMFIEIISSRFVHSNSSHRKSWRIS